MRWRPEVLTKPELTRPSSQSRRTTTEWRDTEMFVNLYDGYEADPDRLIAAAVDLTDAFPPGDGEIIDAEAALTQTGRYLAGGGAAATVLLVRVLE